MIVLLIFNVASTTCAILCARRSYRRYGNAGRAMVAGFGGLMILPFLVILATAVAVPRAARLP